MNKLRFYIKEIDEDDYLFCFGNTSKLCPAIISYDGNDKLITNSSMAHTEYSDELRIIKRLKR